jgi:hypothetical protein
MASQTQTCVFDDLTGAEGAVEYKFSIGDVLYEIDLCDGGQAIRDALAPLIAVARRPQIPAVRARGGVLDNPPPTSADKERNILVRRWATDRGMKVALRGRIAQNVFDAYYAQEGHPV